MSTTSLRRESKGATENLAVVLHKAKDLRMESTALPEKPGPDELLLRGEFCGICGTDVHLWQSAKLGIFTLDKPLILGHEGSATVVKVGKHVRSDFQPGDRVVIENAVPCGKCKFCLRGTYNYCETCSIQAKGLPPADGLIRRYYTHPAAFCHKIPKELSLEVAALAEPLAVAVHAVNRAQITFGQKILVCGAGTMGLLCFLTAKAYGASKVCVIDIMQNKLDKAKELGADYTILSTKGNTPENLSEQAVRCLGGYADVTLECTGSEICVITSILATVSGGKVTLVGLGPDRISIPLSKSSLKEIDLMGVCRYRNSYPQAVELLSTRSEFVKFITHIFPLERYMEAFEAMRKGEGLKILIKCN